MYTLLGRCYEGKGDKNKAKEYYQKVLGVKYEAKATELDKTFANERIAALSSSWW